MKNSTLGIFKLPLAATVVGLVLAFVIGQAGEGLAAGFKAVFFCAVLSLLEISLSFDNAVVNAGILKRMSEVWRTRFLTWGILIAVFGMRLVFPLLIAAILAKLGPIEALTMAVTRPDDYASIMENAHIPVAAFGGTFLLMVALRHFFSESETRWLKPIENAMARFGRLPMSDIAITLAIIGAIAPFTERPFLYAGLIGLLTFIIVDGLANYLGGEKRENVHRASLGLFIYLEVLDASFSFDGVVGAFAITTNLFLITIGLGIGAFFVRSLTVLLVEKGTLEDFKYLEAGAFWAIFSLALILFVSVFIKVPEIATGLTGAAFIGAAFVSSLRARGSNSRRERTTPTPSRSRV